MLEQSQQLLKKKMGKQFSGPVVDSPEETPGVLDTGFWDDDGFWKDNENIWDDGEE